jgi:hypothetical protein
MEKGHEIWFCRIGATKSVVGELEKYLERPGRRWEDNIKLDLRETGIDGVNWIQLAQDRVQWQACMNTVMNLGVP